MPPSKGLSKKTGFRPSKASKKAAYDPKKRATDGFVVHGVHAKRPRQTVPVRHAPRGEQLKAKVSVAIDPDMLEWANQRAKAKALSLSAVFTTALERARRDESFDKAFAAIGGVDDITDDDMEEIYAEWRAHGLID